MNDGAIGRDLSQPPRGPSLEPPTNNCLALSYLLRGNRLKRHDAIASKLSLLG